MNGQWRAVQPSLTARRGSSKPTYFLKRCRLILTTGPRQLSAVRDSAAQIHNAFALHFTAGDDTLGGWSF